MDLAGPAVRDSHLREPAHYLAGAGLFKERPAAREGHLPDELGVAVERVLALFVRLELGRPLPHGRIKRDAGRGEDRGFVRSHATIANRLGISPQPTKSQPYQESANLPHFLDQRTSDSKSRRQRVRVEPRDRQWVRPSALGLR